MKKIELLAPAGDFECLKAAVQNGANAVYFGADKFNARQNSKNFNKEELKEAIEYAKLRNVKTHLTINILIKNEEFDSAINLIKYAYEAGIDAIIVQDLGLAKITMNLFPKLEVHASTQMTTYNLEGVKQLEKLQFDRVVLARELSIKEIEDICKNSNIDIEIFIHGALCICYSGQCLMSSMIGGRSGNRGTCAGSCRLPYTLLKDDKKVESGYLLSSKDVCTLDILPKILNSGVKSLKVEGRMKSPEYVGLVTSIYRKYIDLAMSDKLYIVEEQDREKLMQIFNRGEFSTGYLNGKLGKNMMYIKKPNHMGIEIGEVIFYNKNKGYVKVKLSKKIELGDSIAINDFSCKISELMIGNNNIKELNKGQIATIGRIYGEIKTNDKVYKTVCNNLNKEIRNSYAKENVKRKLNGEIVIKKDTPLYLKIEDESTKICIEIKKDTIPQIAEKQGITKDRIREQLLKTGNTIFEFENLNIDIDGNLIIPISVINEFRREGLEKLENKIIETFKRKSTSVQKNKIQTKNKNKDEKEITLCINKLNKNIDYTNFKDVNNIYIQFEEFLEKSLEQKIEEISRKFNLYILLPTIIKDSYDKILRNNLSKIANKNVKGIVISNISQLEYIRSLENKSLQLVANYTFNTFNDYTTEELEKLGINKIILSPELKKEDIRNLTNKLDKELIVYGRTLLMTSECCTIGTFKNCTGVCSQGKYILKDRLGFKFPIYTNKINCNNLIYNSKITSIQWEDLNIDSIRIDILDEDERKIEEIIAKHKKNERLEGQEYTNGNLNREV